MILEDRSVEQPKVAQEKSANISFADLHTDSSGLTKSREPQERRGQTMPLNFAPIDWAVDLLQKSVNLGRETITGTGNLTKPWTELSLHDSFNKQAIDLNKEFSWLQMIEKIKSPETNTPPTLDGKVADLTGPGVTDKFGVTGTDLGVSIIAPNGKLISVFGDTFSGGRVGEGDWRSPVALVGTGDASHPIHYEYAAGADPNYARQLIDYVHDNPSTGWSHGGISTIIPDDLLRVGQTIYLHGIENQGFGNVTKTGIWSSDDNGNSWKQVAEFPGSLDKGFAQCWSWDYNPDDGYVYVVSTGFQRDKGMILRRVHPEDIGNGDKYSGWGYANGKWSWDQDPTPITPPGETWGELSLRRLGHDQWLLGGFLSSQYALGYRTIDSPTANLYTTPIQEPVVGADWSNEDPAHNRVAQLYGGFILPGSQLDKDGGVGLVVSQWNTDKGYPYKAMQYKVTLKNTIPNGVAKSSHIKPDPFAG